MKIAISGASGYIGQHLTLFFTEKGDEVVPLGRNLFKEENFDELCHRVESCDVVINLADISSVRVIGAVCLIGNMIYWAVNPFIPILSAFPKAVAGVMTPVPRSMVAPTTGGVIMAETSWLIVMPSPPVNSTTTWVATCP